MIEGHDSRRSVDSNFAQFIEQRFHESWLAPNTYALPTFTTTRAR